MPSFKQTKGRNYIYGLLLKWIYINHQNYGCGVGAGVTGVTSVPLSSLFGVLNSLVVLIIQQNSL
jgi:hypothetical protein